MKGDCDGLIGIGFRESTTAGCGSWEMIRTYIKIFEKDGDRIFIEAILESGDLKGDWLLLIDSSRAGATQKRKTQTTGALERLCFFSVISVHIFSVCSSWAGFFSFLRCQLLVIGA